MSSNAFTAGGSAPERENQILDERKRERDREREKERERERERERGREREKRHIPEEGGGGGGNQNDSREKGLRVDLIDIDIDIDTDGRSSSHKILGISCNVLVLGTYETRKKAGGEEIPSLPSSHWPASKV